MRIVCTIAFLCLGVFSEWKSLVYVNLENNPITCSSIDELRSHNLSVQSNMCRSMPTPMGLTTGGTKFKYQLTTKLKTCPRPQSITPLQLRGIILHLPPLY